MYSKYEHIIALKYIQALFLSLGHLTRIRFSPFRHLDRPIPSLDLITHQ